MKKIGRAILKIGVGVLLLGTVAFFAAIGRAVLATEQLQQQQRERAELRLKEQAPQPVLVLQGQEQALVPCSADAEESIASLLPDSVFYRLILAWKPSLSCINIEMDEDCPVQVYTLTQPEWQLRVPQGYTAYLTLTDAENVPVFEDTVKEEYSGCFTQNETQRGMLTLVGDGVSYDYVFTLSADVKVQVSLATTQCVQGDVLPVLVTGNLMELPMAVRSDLGLCAFVPLTQTGSYAAYLPVAYNCAPGEWQVQVTVGEQLFDLTATVGERQFTQQYMTISQEIADATVNSQAATAEYRSTIYPLYEYTDGKRLWDGVFVQPVSEYRITTEYGLWRYVNGSYSERHSGVDMACALGTPVVAPQNGEVLFAGFLQLSGNTVVLSHGGGVKSMFFHLDSLQVKTGDTVSTGDKIGEVGTTGYSTGPHLHYEVKIGAASIDPMALFDGTSGLFEGIQ